MSKKPKGIGWLAFTLWLVACTDQTERPAPTGFAGLGVSGEGFVQVDPKQGLSFPADYDMHPDYRIEWWYVTANLTDAQGAEYGAQWTLFRQALSPGQAATGWQDGQVWMAHAALTSEHSHGHAERFGRSGGKQAGVVTEPVYRAWLDHWLLRHIPRPGAASDDDPFSHVQVRAQGEDFAFDLVLQTPKPLVLQGEAGYSVKSNNGQASWYYSQPFYQANGSVTLSTGERVAVTGQAWLDREWSSQPLAPEQTGWDWFSLHLNSGVKVMLFRLREQDEPNSFFAGTWVLPDGTSRAMRRDQINMVPLERAEVAGRAVPTQWRLQVANEQLDVR
ncbi:MAG: lipocalin-like domain-containing protein, partial [Natronospirillum sp.]